MQVHRGRWLLVFVAVLALAVVASLAVGARSLAPPDVWHGLIDPSDPAATVVRRLRLPRSGLGLLVGVALGLAGALMQALTRNPLADPGLLGVNAGASAAVVSAISFLGVTGLSGYIWFAFAGAAVVTVVVWAVAGGATATPAGLALSGTAVTAVLYAYVAAVQLLDTASLDRMRFWTAGSLAAASPGTARLILPFVAAGVLVTAALARTLNVMALGDDTARALGTDPARVRAVAAVAVVLLCGAATAACGPIVFLGLMVPHLVRPLTGPDLRWLLAFCAVLAPALLLGADVVGRIVSRPGELQVGVVTAVVGGGFFLAVVRRRRA
ncbi:iron chelate uptake ABC transporter family permease subunit [Dactylosporangium maewongense]|uniref:Iron chelate uptake ABC transporter family permease subunit n=1 Tax=Dactylosporangium maewongense TaxID=634393 RepID=A0ABN1ZIU2_9ACTN